MSDAEESTGVWLIKRWSEPTGWWWFYQVVNGEVKRMDPVIEDDEEYIFKRAQRSAKARATRLGLPYRGLLQDQESLAR